MSKNTILPDGMYWYYNTVSKVFTLIVEDECEFENVVIDDKHLK